MTRKLEWTLEKLERLTSSQRHQLYMNALSSTDPIGVELLSLLAGSGLPYSDDSALRGEDPVAVKIAEIAYSPEGSDRMRQAIDQELPPMAGLDPMLSAALGGDYGSHNRSTTFAGRIAAERMEQLGFRRTGKKVALPGGCIAKRAEFMTAPADGAGLS